MSNGERDVFTNCRLCFFFCGYNTVAISVCFFFLSMNDYGQMKRKTEKKNKHNDTNRTKQNKTHTKQNTFWYGNMQCKEMEK